MPAVDREKRTLLSSDQYDDDAADIDDTENDDEVHSDDEDFNHSRITSKELSERDREVLDDDYETNELLPKSQQRRTRTARGEGSSRNDADKRQSQRDLKRSRRRKRLEGESELMYEMEEGGRLTASSEEEVSRSSVRSAEVDLKGLADIKEQKSARRKRVFRHVTIYSTISLLFVGLLYAAYNASRSTRTAKVSQALLSNGSALFPPTTILVSLDGFRADFLQRGLTPTLNAFVAKGVSPLYMLPSFPSVTFPNHYTMATGLYPEAHGIVGNSFWDPQLEDKFYYTHPESALQPKWWGGEPLWVTAERQGVRTAIHMWPGSEAHIGGIEPAHLDKYNGTEALDRKVRKILEYLDLPGQEHEAYSTLQLNEQRPQLVAAYVPVVDSDGHLYGPNSTEIRATIQSVDTMLDNLFQGLEARNLSQLVNVVIVSDHGMATTDVSRLMQLEDILDTSKIEEIDGWPLQGLRPKNIEDLNSLYDQAKQNTKDNPNVEVYLKDKNMPERYHFSNNDRIAPMWVIPKAGWAIVRKEEFDVRKALDSGEIYHPRGLHGYDHEHPLMRAIFVARGPAFPHKANSRVEVFQNTEVYNIVCDSIGITPSPNNGTLRLPLKPVGLHSDPETPLVGTPADPATHTLTATATTATAESSSTATATVVAEEPTKEQPSNSTSMVGTHPSNMTNTTVESSGTATASPASSETGASDGSGRSRLNKWWQFLTDKIEHAKDWAKGVFGDSKGKGNGNTDSRV